jgi:multiple sugar transport system ATP-binding protein
VIVAAIEYRSLTKTFADGTVAVDDLSLEIPDGEFVVLVGPSGSGKTTVLRMTAGLEDSSAGEILIGGSRVNDVPPMDRNIAMVFQNYALYPHMSVYDNMAFGLKLHKVKKDVIRERVESTAKMLGIDGLLKRKPGQLSGGQRQRVAMGRAIVREPDAFLMDEPLSNLDAKLRVEMRAYVAMLHQNLRTTTVYVTHDQTEAMTMGDRVVVMRGGRLEQCDVPQRLYEHPVNMFVAGFIGSPAMNLLRSPLLANGDRLAVEIGGMEFPLAPSLLRRRPGLRAYAGREVVVGVRPEDMEDAALVPGLNGRPTLDVRVTLAEAMGAEVIAYFPVPVREPSSGTGAPPPPEESESDSALRLLGRANAAGELSLTARLSPRSTATTGGGLRVAVDAERMHFFDPDTEASIW